MNTYTGTKKLKICGLIVYQVIIRDVVVTQCLSREGANSYILKMLAKFR